MTFLDLRNNRLQKLPDEICDLVLLRELLLDYNFVQHLPFPIHRLRGLQVLSASQNLLREVPLTLFQQHSPLEQLILNDNKISRVSEHLGNLTKLRTLLLQNNPIAELPSSIFRLECLTQLGIDWVMYLVQSNQKGKLGELAQKLWLTPSTKVLKGNVLKADRLLSDSNLEKLRMHQAQQRVIEEILKLCKLLQVLRVQKQLEQLRQRNMLNP